MWAQTCKHRVVSSPFSLSLLFSYFVCSDFLLRSDIFSRSDFLTSTFICASWNYNEVLASACSRF